jgi:hypothetical protein
MTARSRSPKPFIFRILLPILLDAASGFSAQVIGVPGAPTVWSPVVVDVVLPSDIPQPLDTVGKASLH